MRTTVTLDPDVDSIIKRAMRERGLTFKAAVNDAIRRGAGRGKRAEEASLPTFSMGDPTLDVTKALQLAGDLEDEVQRARLARGA